MEETKHNEDSMTCEVDYSNKEEEKVHAGANTNITDNNRVTSAMHKVMSLAQQLVPRLFAMRHDNFLDDIESGFRLEDLAGQDEENGSVCSDIRLLDEEAEALLSTMNCCYEDAMTDGQQGRTNCRSFDMEDDSSLNGELKNLTDIVDMLRSDMENAVHAEFGEDGESGEQYNVEFRLHKMVHSNFDRLGADLWKSSLLWSITLFWALFILLKETNTYVFGPTI